VAQKRTRSQTPSRGKKAAVDSGEARSRGARTPSAEERKAPFELESTVIALPLLQKIKGKEAAEQQVIIDVNLEYPGDAKNPVGRENAKQWILARIRDITGSDGFERANRLKNRLTPQYLFGTLTGEQIRELVRRDSESERVKANEPKQRAIYHVWPDFEINAFIVKSARTVKADAARSSFAALGDDIVWAVIDSGVDRNHPHFQRWGNLDLPIEHQDFTGGNDPFADEFGHGTHVAGILAGELLAQQPQENANAPAGASGASAAPVRTIRAVTWQRDENGNVTARVDQSLTAVSGMAPKCKILSLKVLGKNGTGNASSLIAALAYIQEINGYGRRVLIHGVNMSVGYGFEPKWFACGQSPLCVEVDKLVRSGVIVVAAAGNTGYGSIQPDVRGPSKAGHDITINDPGNAELAITVGSTHRDMPYTYGVSYFSSKGPTGDGRLKPDLVAPGEKILSCAAGTMLEEARTQAGDCEYLEHSGTSMAAPHVSGVIAAFLSVRREFIGQPERVKEIFLSSAIDLKRERYFQGHGLVDLMRAIQSV
jgi:subtilisin family serine protease